MENLDARLSREDAVCVFGIVDRNHDWGLSRAEFVDYFIANFARH